MPLSTAQSQVANSEERFRVLIAGRRFGKTHLAIRELARFSRYPNRQVVYLAPTYRQAKTIVWKQLKEKLGDLNWIKRANESELTVYLINGTSISLRSADNYDSIRGIGIDFIVFDEFADIDGAAWAEVIRPALSDRQGHALFIGTPKGTANWAKDLYDRGQIGDTDWVSYQFTTIDGGNVKPEEIEAARNDLDERTFRQEYLASFETYSATIYYNYKPAYITVEKPEITPKTTIHIGLDFNVSPMSAVIGIQDNKKLHIVDEITIYGSNTSEMGQEILNRYPTNPIIVYPDASGGHRSTNGKSDHNILRQFGFTIKAPNKNPAVKDRINSVNAAFENANGENRLLINKKCKTSMDCLSRQSYKQDTLIPDKDSGFDHMNDALGYMVHTLMPIKRPHGITNQVDYFGGI